MSTTPDYVNKAAFSTRCLPGSVAEQQEEERVKEFHRCKALRKAEEAQDKPRMMAQREQEYLAACQANKERMHKKRATYVPLIQP